MSIRDRQLAAQKKGKKDRQRMLSVAQSAEDLHRLHVRAHGAGVELVTKLKSLSFTQWFSLCPGLGFLATGKKVLDFKRLRFKYLVAQHFSIGTEILTLEKLMERYEIPEDDMIWVMEQLHTDRATLPKGTQQLLDKAMTAKPEEK